MRVILFYCFLFLLSSCVSTAQIEQINKANMCSFLDKGTEIHWEQIINTSKLNLTPKVRQTKLPLKYSVYQVNEQDLKAFLLAAQRSTEPLIMFIPVNNECISFKVAASGTMSKELAAKFPDLVSLKGMATHKQGTSVRIDYTDGNLKMEIQDNGQVYLMETWTGKVQNYFLIFDKNDADYIKTPNDPY